MKAINPMTLPNVTLDPKVNGTKDDWRIDNASKLNVVVYELAINKPLWSFVCMSGYNDIIHEIRVYQEGELLGSLERTYFRNEYKVEVNCHRIAAARKRNGGFRTSDVDKAVSTAKKMFSRKNPMEVINDALSAAAKMVGEEMRTREYEQRRQNHLVDTAMLAYVKDTIEGRSMFMRFVRDQNNTKVTEAIEKAERMGEELRVLLKCKSIGGAENTLVLRRDEGYLIRHAGVLKHAKDDELSMEFRAKLGMLKLIEDKHFVDDAGGRVDENTFIVFGPPNNVSQEGESNEQS